MVRNVIRVETTPQDMAQSRFATSPLLETVHSLWIMSGRRPAGPHSAWKRQNEHNYATLHEATPALSAITSLMRFGYNMDFIVPPPRGTATSIEEELATVRSTPLAQARSEIRRNLNGHSRPSPKIFEILEASDVTYRLADALALAWDILIAPHWDRFKAILEQEILQRGSRLALAGWAQAVGEITPEVRWYADDTCGHLEILGQQQTGHYRLNGQGFLWIPSIFAPFAFQLDAPWPYALIYSSPGIATAWESEDVRPNEALERLLGRSRATVLQALSAPGTTTQLVARLGMSLGSVGDHLSVLRGAGLVIRMRLGRSVIYRRTPIGDALAEGDRPESGYKGEPHHQSN
ncbi:ArsR/SmtB family transcription factor [Streptosporangium saharense]|uniref:ArsR/SmtB family transcription factor n=1 Tax=Streptosporangium saharense TaxID=1706840 RepID=UPI003442A1B3